MRLLDRYIARVVLLGTVLALSLLLSVDAFFAFIGEVSDIGEGNYGLIEAFRYILFTLPRRAYTLFPFAVLLGSILGLGVLASNSELVAVRAAGMSIARVLLSVLMVGLMMQVVATVIGEYVAPVAEQRAQLQREMDKSRRITFKSAYGLWARDGDKFVNIREILPGGRLGGIYVYELNDKMQVIKATQARYAGFNNDQWTLLQVRQSILSEHGVETRKYPKLAWETLLSPDLLRVLVIDPKYHSIRDLARYIDYLDENELEAGHYRLAFWTNIAAPVSSLVMLFLSVPFVFGSLRSVGTGQRLLVGVLVGLSYYLLTRTVSQLSQVYDISPVVGVFAPLLLFFGIGLFGLRQVTVKN